MAQKVLVSMVDDLDGGEATDTVRFGLDGTEYEIDLSAANAGELRKTLTPYVEAARRSPANAALAGRTRMRGGRGRQSAQYPGVASDEVRAWAKERGIKINDRGRIPAAVVMEYRASRNSPAATAVPAPNPEAEPTAPVKSEEAEAPAEPVKAATPAKATAARGAGKAATKSTAAKSTAKSTAAKSEPAATKAPARRRSTPAAASASAESAKA